MAYGSPYAPDLPTAIYGQGMKTPFGMIVNPPGSRIAAYVRSTGVLNTDDPFIASNLVTTLAAGLARARSGYNDVVVVLPGHSESVTDATMLTNLVAGTRIVGTGRGSNMPTFRWTATGSQWAVAVADVTFSGLRLRLEGANGVVKAILVTAADVGFHNCDIEVASGASNKATIALELGAGADRFEVIGNVFRGTATHNVTDGVKVVSAVTGGRILQNEMVFSATAGNGNIHVTAAALNLKVGDNVLYNTHTASTATIALDNVAMDGIFYRNISGTKNDGTANAQGIVVAGASVLCVFSENYSVDEKAKSGVLNPAAVAT